MSGLDKGAKRGVSVMGKSSDPSRRRKVRKGTQSCWECKRRKIRCTFNTPGDVCDGCQSRRTKCIGQEFQDEGNTRSGKIDKLSRLESLVENLVSGSNIDVLRRTEQLQSDHTYRRRPNHNPVAPSESRSKFPFSAVSTFSVRAYENKDLNQPDDLSRTLLAEWPSQRDLDLVLSIPVSVSMFYHGVVCRPYAEFFCGEVTSARAILEPTSEVSHPVLIARKMLLLATFLQGIPSYFADKLAGLTSDYNAMISRLFATASRLVTSNDELLNSIEGIECLMIESMFLNNAGNLRRAWLINRKAMAIAQMLGLHATDPSAQNLTLEDETRNRIYPSYMWFRINCTDKYLSLMLGLPQGCFEDNIDVQRTFKGYDPLERMERLETMAAGLVLQRNSIDQADIIATRKIDKILQESASIMPPQWWLMATNPFARVGSDPNAFKESIRIMLQFAHHHLLIQLHLPYLLLSDPAYDYNKITAVNASRAIVTLFASFRMPSLAPAYCRGIDFIAFIASTVLCLAYIKARRHRSDGIESPTIFQSLQHQRSSDRGLLERTYEIIKSIAEDNDDAVAKKIVSLLRPLLAIENNSLDGGCYYVDSSPVVDDRESQCIGNTNEDFHALHLQIPHFGTIRIEHQPPSSQSSRTPSRHSRDWSWSLSLSQPLVGSYSIPAPDRDKDSRTAIDGVQQTSIDFDNNISESIQPDLDKQVLNKQSEPTSEFPSLNILQETAALFPGLSTEVEDWILQGVDTALFSSLTHGLSDQSHSSS